MLDTEASAAGRLVSSGTTGMDVWSVAGGVVGLTVAGVLILWGLVACLVHAVEERRLERWRRDDLNMPAALRLDQHQLDHDRDTRCWMPGEQFNQISGGTAVTFSTTDRSVLGVVAGWDEQGEPLVRAGLEPDAWVGGYVSAGNGECRVFVDDLPTGFIARVIDDGGDRW